MSLVTSTGGVTLLPLYVQLMLPPSVVIRPLQGEAPTIDLVMGYSRSNTSPLLKRFLSRTDELVARVVSKERPRWFRGATTGLISTRLDAAPH